MLKLMIDGRDNNLAKSIFSGFALASVGFFTASSIQNKRYEKASRYCHRERRKNVNFNTRTARRLIREVFPNSQNRNIAIHLHPFSAGHDEIRSGVVEGTRMLSEATRSKFVGHIYYWTQGVTRDRFLHEVGHIKDDYELWLSNQDSFTDELQAITYGKTAAMMGVSIKDRLFHGKEVLVEESAWNQVKGSIRNKKNRTAGIDTYRHSRNSDLLSLVGTGSLMVAVYIGSKSAAEMLIQKVMN
ncbi:MAG: hypothetical protein HOD11_01280 [Candidatus Marinimicrobia bacterium]|nr:hypothetical protein [Candidatus Neomarinimicrobiota bacterium]